MEQNKMRDLILEGLMSEFSLEEAKQNMAIVTKATGQGHVPQLVATHAEANTISCMVAEQLVSEGRKFHEVYAAPQDAPENLRRKEKDIKDEETVILVRHEDGYSQEMTDAVRDFMFRYKERLVAILLKKKKKGDIHG